MKIHEDTLELIKYGLDVELLPFFEYDRANYRVMLDRFHNMIRAKNWEDAKVLHDKLAVIEIFQFEKELNVLFSLFSSRFLLATGEVEKADNVLCTFDDKLDSLNQVQLYHYYFDKGLFYFLKSDCKSAYDYFLKAYDLTEYGLRKYMELYHYLAYCCDELGYVIKSITFIDEVKLLKSVDKTIVDEIYLDNLLGKNYRRLGYIQKSKEYLDKAYPMALENYKNDASEYNKNLLGAVLCNYGCIYIKNKTFHIANEYLDKSSNYITRENPLYLELIYQKTLVSVTMKNPLIGSKLISEGKELAKNNEIYLKMFEALDIMLNINDDLARKMETEIIPYLMENNCFYPALDYAMFIRNYHKGKLRPPTIRVGDISDVICTINDRMHEGEIAI